MDPDIFLSFCVLHGEQSQAGSRLLTQAAFEDHGPHREDGFQCSQHSDPENPGLWILAGNLKFSKLVNELRVGIQES